MFAVRSFEGAFGFCGLTTLIPNPRMHSGYKTGIPSSSVTIFTVLISTVTQIYFNDQLDIKRGEISSLDSQLNELITQLEIATTEKKKLKKKVSELSLNLKNLEKEKKLVLLEKEDLEENLTKNNYLLKIKDKEINLLVTEKSEFLDD